MQEGVIPQDPLGEEPVLDSRIDGLESRIAQLEAEKTAKSLSAEDQYNRLLRHEVLQRIGMRYAAVLISITVLVVMGCFASHVLDKYFLGKVVLISPSLAIALFVAPIVSMSAVTIMLLIGAFRRFKDDDLEQINSQAVLASVQSATTGN